MKIHYESGWFHDDANDLAPAVAHAQETGGFKNGKLIGETLSFHLRRQGEGWEWERTSIEVPDE